jgi:hypothetical protein
MKQAGGSGGGILGIGAAACLVCCAGPILAFLGGVGIAGIASTLLVGAAGLGITAAAITGFVVVGRHRRSCARADEAPMPVAAPTTRAPQP